MGRPCRPNFEPPQIAHHLAADPERPLVKVLKVDRVDFAKMEFRFKYGLHFKSSFWTNRKRSVTIGS